MEEKNLLFAFGLFEKHFTKGYDNSTLVKWRVTVHKNDGNIEVGIHRCTATELAQFYEPEEIKKK